MIYGYIRVSTDRQDYDSQANQLERHTPGLQIHAETASGAKNRPVLEELLQTLQGGDTLVVAGIDRLGRRTVEVVMLLEALLGRGVTVISLREGQIRDDPTGRFLLTILSAAAELERSMIVSRVKAGVAAAKAKGKQVGRQSQLTPFLIKQISALRANGCSIRHISAVLNLPKSTVHDFLRQAA